MPRRKKRVDIIKWIIIGLIILAVLLTAYKIFFTGQAVSGTNSTFCNSLNQSCIVDSNCCDGLSCQGGICKTNITTTSPSQSKNIIPNQTCANFIQDHIDLGEYPITNKGDAQSFYADYVPTSIGFYLGPYYPFNGTRSNITIQIWKDKNNTPDESAPIITKMIIVNKKDYPFLGDNWHYINVSGMAAAARYYVSFNGSGWVFYYSGYNIYSGLDYYSNGDAWKGVGQHSIYSSAQKDQNKTPGDYAFSIIYNCSANCTSIGYSNWNGCVNGKQTRTITDSSPTGCIPTTAVLTQNCTGILNSSCQNNSQCSSGFVCKGGKCISQLQTWAGKGCGSCPFGSEAPSRDGYGSGSVYCKLPVGAEARVSYYSGSGIPPENSWVAWSKTNGPSIKGAYCAYENRKCCFFVFCGKCGGTTTNYLWQVRLNSSTVCVPDCSCASNTCAGTTCSNGCGGTCTGTKQKTCQYSSWVYGQNIYSNGDCGSCTRKATRTFVSGTCGATASTCTDTSSSSSCSYLRCN